MKHKYKVGCWVRFYKDSKFVIGVVEYLPKKESWEGEYSYHTNIGVVEESSIIECRFP